MSAKYSLLVMVIVAALLIINSMWLSLSDNSPCTNCDHTAQKTH